MQQPLTSATIHPQRLSATLLLALFTAFLLLPGLFAATQPTEDTSLPACCRTHGKHHCSMRQRPLTPAGNSPVVTQLSERCPYTPAAPVATHGTAVHLAVSAATFAEIASHPAVRPQTEARRRIAQLRSNQKRGPPAPLLLA